MDEYANSNISVTKTVNFPLSILNTIDKYGRIRNFSRTQIVISALREYINNHKIDEFLNK